MQRTSYDLEDRLDVDDRVDVSELAARIAAERGHPIHVDDDRVGVTELIARLAAERNDDPMEDTGRHHLRIEIEPEVPGAQGVREVRRASRRRRLAPAIAGVATVVVASTIALSLRAGDEDPAAPELDAALVGASIPGAAAAPEASATVPAPVQNLDLPALPPVTEAAAAPSAAPTPAPTTKSPARRPAAAPSGAAKPAPVPAANDGTQAAAAQGWKLVDRDEFNGAVGAKWSPYEGEGHAGDGRRTPEAIGVRDGAVVIRGDEEGNTGGMSWKDGREAGRWEMRAKFPKGDAAYHPVLLLWPDDGGSDDGEIDFAETTSASDSVSFFLHHGSGDQESAKKQLDITQWHNYAVEVTSDRVTGYIDGQKWFESTDPDTLPRGPVHPVIQLDWFPEGDSPEPTELLVDWMRIYE